MLPVAPHWFRFTVLDERTTLIDEPHVRGGLRGNMWHLRGRDRDLLIDCGLGVAALAPLLRERFGREPVLVLTHAHLDHMGSAHEFSGVGAHALADGDRVDLGDRTLTVLHLPGHSPGSIALFDASDGTLFSGDVIYDDVLLDCLPGSDPERYARSLRWLRDLPVRLTHPGHGPSFGPDRLRHLIDDYLRPR